MWNDQQREFENEEWKRDKAHSFRIDKHTMHLNRSTKELFLYLSSRWASNRTENSLIPFSLLRLSFYIFSLTVRSSNTSNVLCHTFFVLYKRKMYIKYEEMRENIVHLSGTENSVLRLFSFVFFLLVIFLHKSLFCFCPDVWLCLFEFDRFFCTFCLVCVFMCVYIQFSTLNNGRISGWPSSECVFFLRHIWFHLNWVENAKFCLLIW